LATGLWTGVQAINAEAKNSYAASAEQIAPEQFASLVSQDGKPLSIADFVALRQGGWRVSPVLRGQLEVGGRSLDIIGIEPLTTPFSFGATDQRGGGTPAINLDFLSGAGQALVNSTTAERLVDAEGLPPLVIAPSVPSDTVLVDISIAEQLLERSGEIDRLMLAAEQPLLRVPLTEISQSLRLIEPREPAADAAQLTDSFHLSLTAFGFLSFAVGLFIVHASVGLAFEQRRATFRTLRTLGLSARGLTGALAVELLVLALVAGGFGVVLGYVIAAFLLPDVAATLRGLYGADISGQPALRPEWWARGLAIALIGTFVAAAGSLWNIMRLPVLASAQPRAWAMQTVGSARAQTALAVSGLVLSALLLAFGSGLPSAFATLALFLIGCALLLPFVFRLVLKFGEAQARSALAQWFWADMRQQIRGLSLALMALLLALAANVGVSTMVGSFRTTFTGWLDQRLVAEIYLRVESDEQRRAVLQWLDGRADAVLPIARTDATLAGHPGEIFAMANHPTYREKWPLLSARDDHWDDLASGRSVLINEQLSLRAGLGLGDAIMLPRVGELPITAIYSDYGNPAVQVIVGLDTFSRIAPETPFRQFALRVPPDRVSATIAELRAHFGLSAEAVIDQSGIKQFSLRVFDRTFLVTDALNVLTFAVAGLAIFTSLLTLGGMRLPQLAPVWALGLTRSQLAWLELARALLLAVLTAILAIPVGLVLAWMLLALVNVEAFGWRLPMLLFPLDYLRLGALALVAAGIAAAIPAWRLSRIAPADLVKVFAHER
jgi:putative ABC transport system permease protein